MKTPELPSPSPSTRSYVPRIVDPIAPGTEREDKFQPRYVEVPALREHGYGRRNLAWGVITLILALVLLVAAVVVAGQKAVLALTACLVTFAALFVLARMHVFRQRNGGFLAIAVVVLLAAVVALVDRGYEKLVGISAPLAGAAAARPVETEPPLLTEAFALGKPDPAQTHVKVLKDSRVVIGEKPFLIKVGDVFPLLEMKGGEATFAVRDLHVSLPVSVVEILGGKLAKDSPAKEAAVKDAKETKEAAMAAALAAVAVNEVPKPEPVSNPGKPAAPTAADAELAAITKSAQIEATQRYPALAVRDSLENEMFVSAYRQLKASGNTDFFANPEWPLELAETLATRNGWSRGDKPAAPAADLMDTAPPFDAAAADAAPANAGPRVPQQLPPNEDEPPQVPRAPRL